MHFSGEESTLSLNFKRIFKGIGWFLGVVFTASFLAIVILLLTCIWISQPRTMEVVRGGIYEAEVIYYPVRGAMGPNNSVAVRVSGGKWDNKRLVDADAADTMVISFTDSTHVQVVTLWGGYYTKPSGGSFIPYWRRADTAQFDLTGPIEEKKL